MAYAYVSYRFVVYQSLLAAVARRKQFFFAAFSFALISSRSYHQSEHMAMCLQIQIPFHNNAQLDLFAYWHKIQFVVTWMTLLALI